MDIGGREQLIDTHISEQAETILTHRYYLKDKEGNILEDNVQLFRRVAHALAQVEHVYETLPTDIDSLENKFFDMMASL